VPLNSSQLIIVMYLSATQPGQPSQRVLVAGEECCGLFHYS